MTDEITALRARLDALNRVIVSTSAMLDAEEARAERAEAALATARRDAYERAAQVAELSWQRWRGEKHGRPRVECDVTACDNIAAAIRALIAQEPVQPSGFTPNT